MTSTRDDTALLDSLMETAAGRIREHARRDRTTLAAIKQTMFATAVTSLESSG